MAQIPVTFDLSFIGSGNTTVKEDWYDLGTIEGVNSPIPSGKHLWLGYATFSSADKALVFELRSNIPGASTASLANTVLRGYASTDPSAGSANIDMYQFSNIVTLCPKDVPSTGVEKLWLRVWSGTNTVASFNYLINYALY